MVQLLPRTWNEEFIDAPVVKNQKQPSTDKEGMENILKGATGRYRVLYALLAGAGRCALVKPSDSKSTNTSHPTAVRFTSGRRREDSAISENQEWSA